MSYKSERVKAWRRKTKERIVESLGGMCTCCGYSGIALDIHHLDPSIKEFSFSSVRANSKSWDKIVEELRKCVLLCSNCHREIHAGIRELPENCFRFDEKFSTYKPEYIIYNCIGCGKIIAKNETGMCKNCFPINRRKFSITKDELERMVWEKPVSHIADIFGVSDKAIHNRLKKFGIQIPPIGYWSRRSIKYPKLE